MVVRFERELIEDTLRRVHGVQRRAARILGIKPTTLNEKIKRLGIRLPR
jgi:transcriptional regulator with GAF, ATPase, and Fis domain